jgi:hypothetical protein
LISFALQLKHTARNHGHRIGRLLGDNIDTEAISSLTSSTMGSQAVSPVSSPTGAGESLPRGPPSLIHLAADSLWHQVPKPHLLPFSSAIRPEGSDWKSTVLAPRGEVETTSEFKESESNDSGRLSFLGFRPPIPRSSLSDITANFVSGYRCTFPGCISPPFQTPYLLNSHINVHSSARPHYCPVPGCPRAEGGKGFKRKNEAIRHGLVHEQPGYTCPFCPDRVHKYPRPDNLQRYCSLLLIAQVLWFCPEGKRKLRLTDEQARASTPY